MASFVRFVQALLLFRALESWSFVPPSPLPRAARQNVHRQPLARARQQLEAASPRRQLSMALGDFTVELRKPLGLVLEERDGGDGDAGGGVRVKELAEGGAAASLSDIAPGDVLLRINDEDVSSLDFDSVMNLLLSLEDDVPVRLTVGDGLGAFDMPKNVLKLLKTTDDAYFVDAIVRRAVRTMRQDGELGDVLRVEVIIGAGVRDEEDGGGQRGQVRFFAIFSTGGASSYSCNVSATGVRRTEDGNVQIVTLAAAKDEGLGQTRDFL